MKKFLTPLAAVFLLSSPAPAATQVDLVGPPGSGEFGRAVSVLPNGHFVVTDPSFDLTSPLVADVGAVYLYNPDGLLISTLRGSSTGDLVGSGGVVLLTNGNFVIRSTSWSSGAGAVTWGSATTGFIGSGTVVVSSANSLVGLATTNSVGIAGVVPLTNGHYVVRSTLWDNTSPTAADAGAVTWGNGTTGTTGSVTSSNSLVGTTANDSVGNSGVTPLPNGNYVVRSSNWDNTSAGAANAGAVTWASGTTGLSGPVSAANSLVGTSVTDQVGSNNLTVLANGHYVVRNPSWDSLTPAVPNAGAVTWGSGTTGVKGAITIANSLIGTTTEDRVGSAGVTALTQGNYVVRSFEWDDPVSTTSNVGAVTWANGLTGLTGHVTAENSLVGTTASDLVGNQFVTALTNGNYVVSSSAWTNTAVAAAAAGAVTWGSGTNGITGPVTPANSLVGTSPADQVGGSAVLALTNGNYVVGSASWDNTAASAADAGAVTWGSGTTGIRGPVSAANSLIGTSADDVLGNGGLTALTNGNYVICSHLWNNPATGVNDVGAVTWGSGTTGIKGPVTAGNSLVGTTTSDFVGANVAVPLTNGNYVVISSSWDNPAVPATNAGAVTWGSGITGIKGPVTASNSLVGTTANDFVGQPGVTALSHGNYIVNSQQWNRPAPAAADAGAITWGSGTTGISGVITAANSLVGTSPNDSLGNVPVTDLASDSFVFNNLSRTNPAIPAPNAGAIGLGNAAVGSTGQVNSANSVVGTAISGGGSMVFGYDPDRHQLVVGRSLSNLVTLFRGDRLRTLAKSGLSAPGALDIAYAKPGTTAVSALGTALTDFSLSGSGAKGKNRAFIAFSPVTGTDLVLQSGTPLSSLGGGLPSNAVATALHSQVFHQPNRALFQATVKGTGVIATNNRLLLLDNGIGISLLHRSGSSLGIGALTTAAISSFTEVLQSHDQDLITLAYKLKPSAGVNSASDEGLLFLNHSGSIGANIAAREGQPAFGGGGDFGSFKGRAAAGLGTTIHFTALFKPTGGKPIPAVFSTTLDGVTTARLAKAGDSAPGSGGATFSTFPAISQQSGSALVKATLKGSPTSQNEGLYRLPVPGLLTRKGDPIGGGLNISRILRFWPAGPGQVILHLQVTGTNVTGSNNQVLALRQSDDTYLILLRTGFPAPGTGPATVKTLSAVDVNTASGRYAVLATLSGAPASSNQALWTGNPTLGNPSPALQNLRLPQLTLRKGNAYSTPDTPQSLIRSIALKPAIDPTGAGGRGLAQALGALGDLALILTEDRKLTEAVLLDR